MRAFIGIGIAAVVVAVSSWGCLVHSGCLSDDDCQSPERCFTDGVCRLECDDSSTLYCPSSRPLCMVSEFRCVACLGAEDCTGLNEECVNTECVPSAVPDFTLVDQNPESPTYGDGYTLSELEGQVVMVFFAGLG